IRQTREYSGAHAMRCSRRDRSVRYMTSLLKLKASCLRCSNNRLRALPSSLQLLMSCRTRRLHQITVVEHVHWADEATLDLLKFLGRRISRIKAMLIITYRDDEVARDHPLRLVLGDLPHRSVARLRLLPLSEASVDTLAERTGRRIEDLYEVTGGNPFFVTEALASKGAGIPSTVRDAVLSRAARLSPASRTVLELVSVVPARTQMWLLNDTIRPDTDLLEECVSSGILRYEA